jgi:hypothetical protein
MLAAHNKTSIRSVLCECDRPAQKTVALWLSVQGALFLMILLRLGATHEQPAQYWRAPQSRNSDVVSHRGCMTQWECGARCAAVNEVAFFWRPTASLFIYSERAQPACLCAIIKTSIRSVFADVRPAEKRVALWHSGVQGAAS